MREIILNANDMAKNNNRRKYKDRVVADPGSNNDIVVNQLKDEVSSLKNQLAEAISLLKGANQKSS